MQTLLTRGLAATASYWPALGTVYGWVHEAAHLLDNPDALSVEALQGAYRQLLAKMDQQRETVGDLASAVHQFLKVTESYWPGLFYCYEVRDLPRTNNDLEQFFGSARYHERRATGRKTAASTVVVRGAVRLLAAVVTRHQPPEATALRLQDVTAWRRLRSELDQRRQARAAQWRFRHDSTRYLAQLEASLLQASLPP